MEELTDLTEVACMPGYDPLQEEARAELRLITPTVRKVYKHKNLTNHFKDLLKMAKAKKAAGKGSVNYRPAHAEPNKTSSPSTPSKSKKSPAKPIIKKKMADMKTKTPIKTKGQKASI